MPRRTNDECHCDLGRVDNYWLHRQWHAANPGVRPTPWETPRPLIIVEPPITEEVTWPALPQLPPPTQLRARPWTPRVLMGGRP